MPCVFFFLVGLFVGLLIRFIIVNLKFFIILHMVFSDCPYLIQTSWLLEFVFVISPACTGFNLLNCCCLNIVHIYMKNIVILDVIQCTLIQILMFAKMHLVTYQKAMFFMVTALRVLNPTYFMSVTCTCFIRLSIFYFIILSSWVACHIANLCCYFLIKMPHIYLHLIYNNRFQNVKL
jgi:hypothetical protein